MCQTSRYALFTQHLDAFKYATSPSVVPPEAGGTRCIVQDARILFYQAFKQTNSSGESQIDASWYRNPLHILIELGFSLNGKNLNAYQIKYNFKNG